MLAALDATAAEIAVGHRIHGEGRQMHGTTGIAGIGDHAVLGGAVRADVLPGAHLEQGGPAIDLAQATDRADIAAPDAALKKEAEDDGPGEDAEEQDGGLAGRIQNTPGLLQPGQEDEGDQDQPAPLFLEKVRYRPAQTDQAPDAITHLGKGTDPAPEPPGQEEEDTEQRPPHQPDQQIGGIILVRRAKQQVADHGDEEQHRQPLQQAGIPGPAHQSGKHGGERGHDDFLPGGRGGQGHERRPFMLADWRQPEPYQMLPGRFFQGLNHLGHNRPASSRFPREISPC